MSESPARSLALEYADILHELGPISVSRYFGDAGLRKDGVLFAFVMHGSLYLWVDAESCQELEALGAEPFISSGASGPVTVAGYSPVPDVIANSEPTLLAWAERASRIAKTSVSVRVPKRNHRALPGLHEVTSRRLRSPVVVLKDFVVHSPGFQSWAHAQTAIASTLA